MLPPRLFDAVFYRRKALRGRVFFPASRRPLFLEDGDAFEFGHTTNCTPAGVQGPGADPACQYPPKSPCKAGGAASRRHRAQEQGLQGKRPVDAVREKLRTIHGDAGKCILHGALGSASPRSSPKSPSGCCGGLGTRTRCASRSSVSAASANGKSVNTSPFTTKNGPDANMAMRGRCLPQSPMRSTLRRCRRGSPHSAHHRPSSLGSSFRAMRD